MTEKEIWDKAYNRIFELYGDMPDLRIVSRFYSEKQTFMQYEVGKYFYDLAKLRREAEAAGERLIVKNAAASCLIAYLLGATDENPLPAHYYCTKCKTVRWMEGRCVFDLRDRTCACGGRMKSDGFDVPFETYLQDCFAFGQAAQGKILTVYRLCNQGGEDLQNGRILSMMERFFPGPWVKERLGTRISDRVYLEYGDKFDWPDLSVPEGSDRLFCYGLRDQLGVLCDGSVVPCCLDHEGDLTLGNLFSQSVEEILATPRAQAIYNGFSNRQAAETLCRRCGYARRFQ